VGLGDYSATAAVATETAAAAATAAAVAARVTVEGGRTPLLKMSADSQMCPPFKTRTE